MKDRDPQNHPGNDEWREHEKIERRLEAKVFLFEQKGGAGANRGRENRDEKGHLEANPDAVEVDRIVEYTHPVGPIGGKPLHGESLPGQGRKLGIVERQNAGDYQRREQKKKVEPDIEPVARGVCFALGSVRIIGPPWTVSAS